MSNSVENLGAASDQIILWKAQDHLRPLSALAVKMSCGFLRCRPERLFPNFAGYWTQFLTNFGLSFKLKHIRSSLELPKEIEHCIYSRFNQETVGLCFDNQTLPLLQSALIPDADDNAQRILLDYLARRIMSDLHRAWTGPEMYRLSFEEGTPKCDFVACIEVEFELNAGSGRVWFLLPNLIAEQLDNIWRGEVRSATKAEQSELEVHLEIAALDIGNHSIAEYTSPGALIDLECELTDRINLRIGSRYWLPARLFTVDSYLGFEILPGIVSSRARIAEHNHLRVEFGVERLHGGMLAELGQVGACHRTSIGLDQRVNIVIGEEKVSAGTLGIYQGRYAVCVV